MIEDQRHSGFLFSPAVCSCSLSLLQLKKISDSRASTDEEGEAIGGGGRQYISLFAQSLLFCPWGLDRQDDLPA